MKLKIAGFLAALNLFLSIPAVSADGVETAPEGLPSQAGMGKDSPELRDKRLPAVMPGQEVQSNGKKMNVWSTSGPVEVAQPPEPWKKDSDQIKVDSHGVGIVVDQRRPRTRESDRDR